MLRCVMLFCISWCCPDVCVVLVGFGPVVFPLCSAGMLDKYGVELIGAKLPSIDRAEDRELFKQAMKRIGLKTPPRYTH